MDGGVKRCKLFRDSQYEESSVGGLQLLQALYVRRCHSFWKEGMVFSWLQNVVRNVRDSLHLSAVQERIAVYADQ